MANWRLYWDNYSLVPSKKAGLQHGIHQLNHPLVEVQMEIKGVYKHFHHIKQQVDCRETWIAQIIASQAMATNRATKSLWKQLWTTEHICKMAKNVKKALHQGLHHCLLAAVTAPNTKTGT